MHQVLPLSITLSITWNSIKGGGMVTDFSGGLILSNALVVIGRASTDNLGVLLGPRAQCGPCGHRWQKVAQKTKI